MRLPRVRRWGRSAIVRWEEFEPEACTSFWIVAFMGLLFRGSAIHSQEVCEFEEAFGWSC